jgi:diguanylate cyclase (GGDEF)-like protein
MNNPPLKADILIVDDTIENLNLLATMLQKRGYKVRKALNGSIALMGVRNTPPDLILLDIKMPEMNGYEVCEQLKADPKTRPIPVIFISALGEVLDKVKAFSLGAVDYITKPFEIEEVMVRVENQLALKAAKAEIEKLNQSLELRVRERTAQLEAEIQERKNIEQKLRYLASHDVLTGLPNRLFFMKKLKLVLQQTKQEPDYQFAVLFIDCDRFKIVNDSLGHLIGDKLLIALAKRLEKIIPKNCCLSRFGGDEFVILLTKINNIQETIDLAKQLEKSLKKPFKIGNHHLFMTISIGIVLGTAEYNQPQEILRDADTAMYKAKAKYNTLYQVFEPKMYHNVLNLLRLESELRKALEAKEFIVYYQPIVTTEDKKLVGFEALVRWNHPQKGIISPLKFIPLAEETGLIVPLEHWIFNESCRQIKQWQEQKLIPEYNFSVSVNISPSQFAEPDFIAKIDQALAKNQLESRFLKLEITEGVIIENADSATKILKQLKQRNIQVSLDDFGTGYSSLSYLHRFPLDTLKIDRSFVGRMGSKGEKLEIISTIINLAHSLGMNVIAEGVETEAQFEQLKAEKCEMIQGYLFAKPMDPQKTENYLQTQKQLRGNSFNTFDF